MNTQNNMNAFAVEFYKRLASSDRNAIFSLSNIATMLGMLHLGAIGKTAESLLYPISLNTQLKAKHQFGAIINHQIG